MSTIGDNIKFLREHHKFTPSAVAKKLDINVQDYNAWETGLLLPTIDKVMSICAIYKVATPTELFSESFVQQYNAKDVKSKRAAAIKKAQEEANFNQDTEAKLSFVIPNGSYYNKPFFFNLAIFLAFALMVSYFVPFFIGVPSQVFSEYIAKDNMITSILACAGLLFTIVFVIIALKFNYRVVEHNEFFPKGMASRMKLTYLSLPLIIVACVAVSIILKGQPYELVTLVHGGIAAAMFLSSFIAMCTIKRAKPSSITYNYVMKFNKYRLRSDAARKCLLVFAIIGIVLSVISIALIALQLFMDGGFLGLIGVKDGIIKDFSDAFVAIFNHVNTGLPAIIVLGAAFALFVYTQVMDIVVASQLKKQYQKGDIAADQVQGTKMFNIGNIVSGILSYVLAYATIILGLIANADARIAAAEYYVMPIMTVISIFVVIRLSINMKVHFAYRGSETKEVTGFSEVKQDEQARERKANKKPQKQQAEPKQKPNKKQKGKDAVQEEQPQQPNPTLNTQPSATPAQPAPASAPVENQPSAPNANNSDNKGGQN